MSALEESGATWTKANSMKTASEIMQAEVRTLSPDSTLREAAELLGLWNVSGAPVVDEYGALVGVVSESDLLSEARKRAAIPRTAAFGVFLPVEDALWRIYHEGATLLVGEVMSTKLAMASPDTPLDELGRMLVNRRINRIPVVDDSEKLVGIVTREDVLKALFGL